MRRWMLAAVAVLGVGLGTQGCNSCDPTDLNGEDPPPPPPPGECTTQGQSCPDRQSFRDGSCKSTFCEADLDCCPGTRCDVAFNLCRSRLLDVECMADVDCPVRGQKCVMNGGVNQCVFDACTTDAQCGLNTHCYMGRCVGENPCKVGCGAQEVCEVTTASCHPATGHNGCDVSCGLGTLKVLKNPSIMAGDTCCAWECECSALPALPAGVWGQYASIAVTHLYVNVAAYDATYGDLVVARYSRTGALARLDYVDGFPPTGTVGGSVDGPRRGIVDVGDDVGKWTSSGVDAMGRLHVVYFDETRGALKHALETGEKSWAVHTVDDNGVAGEFASLTFRPGDGVPVVAYHARGIMDATGKPAGAVRLAVARTVSPAATADWDSRVLDVGTVFDACNHTCGAGTTCVLVEGGDAGSPVSCRPNSSACAPACASSQACVTVGTAAECAGLGNPPIAGLERSMGLFTSVAATSDNIAVAYYDGVAGNLKVATVAGMAAPVTRVLDGDGLNGHNDGDVGTHTSMAVDLNGKYAVTYQDNTANALRYLSTSDFLGGQSFVVDSGRGSPPGIHLLGGGASLGFGPDGTAYVVYQEQTTLDLKLGQREPDGTWTVVDPFMDATPAAYGFYTDISVVGTTAYVVSVKPELGPTNELANKPGLLIQDVPMP